MEYTFLFEEALDKAGLDQSKLPAETKNNLSKLTKLCQKLSDTPDENTDELERLNEEIDTLDESIAKDIADLVKQPLPSTPPSNPPAPEPAEKDNTIGIFVGLAVVGGLIWGAMKFFGGKKP